MSFAIHRRHTYFFALSPPHLFPRYKSSSPKILREFSGTSLLLPHPSISSSYNYSVGKRNSWRAIKSFRSAFVRQELEFLAHPPPPFHTTLVHSTSDAFLALMDSCSTIDWIGEREGGMTEHFGVIPSPLPLTLEYFGSTAH